MERAVGRSAAALEAAQPGTGPPLEALERLLTAGWRELARNSAMAQAAAEQLSHATLARTHEPAHRSLAELVERGRADGVFRTDVPPGWLR